MTLHNVLSTKRKELGFTQEQIANYLGVSTPAVNKWEKGSTYPDITLLPALARLLNTDLNTLLCFNQTLSDAEIALFLHQITEIFQADGLQIAFDKALDITHEFPTDGKLLQTIATHLEGLCMMTELTAEQKELYEMKINVLYERVTTCEDEQCAKIARYLLASRYIKANNLSRAQELLDALPEHSTIDKRLLQASYYQKEENYTEAAKLYERILLFYVQALQVPLVKLMQIAVKEDNVANACKLAKCGEELSHILGQWEYTALLYPMELAYRYY